MQKFMESSITLDQLKTALPEPYAGYIGVVNIGEIDYIVKIGLCLGSLLMVTLQQDMPYASSSSFFYDTGNGTFYQVLPEEEALPEK
jgi:hypothetical protein